MVAKDVPILLRSAQPGRFIVRKMGGITKQDQQLWQVYLKFGSMRNMICHMAGPGCLSGLGKLKDELKEMMLGLFSSNKDKRALFLERLLIMEVLYP